MRKITMTALFFLCTVILWGQSSVQTPQVIPPSPQTQVFLKYLNHQITEYNGLPMIEIPLYEISIKGMTIPITLSYHAGGIKYSHFDGEVGSGWSIGAGGYRVSRSIKSNDDFIKDRYDKTYFENLINGPNINPFYLDVYLDGMQSPSKDNSQTSQWSIGSRGVTDAEYDLFTYTLPSTNGHFLIVERQKNGQAAITTILEDNCDRINGINWDNMHITDDRGFNYYLGGQQSNGQNLYETPHWGSVFKNSPTSWVLRQIVSPFNDKINFNYSFIATAPAIFHSSRTLVITEPDLVYTSGTGNSNAGYATIGVESGYRSSDAGLLYDNMLYVNNITTDDISIEFIRYGGTHPAPQLIKEISIKNRNNNEQIRKIIFDYKKIPYVYSNGSEGSIHYLLSSATIYSQNQVEQKYNMEYYGPSSVTSAYDMRLYADQWGFYKEGVQRSEPNIFIHKEFEQNRFVVQANSSASFITRQLKDEFRSNNSLSDRSMNNQDAIHYFSLKKITYPTGGYSQYEYEPHNFRPVNSPKLVTGGGQRIKRIKSVATDSEPVVTIFKYGKNEDGTGVGNIDFTERMFAGESHFINFPTTPSGTSIRTTRYYSTDPIFDISTSLFQVNYPEVATYQIKESDNTTNGKTVSKYDIPQQYYTSELYGGAPSFYGIDNGHVNPVGIAVNKPAYKPLLVNRCQYNGNVKVFEEQNDYINTYSNSQSVYEGLKVNQLVSWAQTIGPEYWTLYSPIPSAFSYMKYNIIRGGHLLSKKTTTTYSLTGTHPTAVIEQYKYNTRNQLIEKRSIQAAAEGSDLVEEYSYPLSNTELERRNMLSTITKTRTGTSWSTYSVVRYNYPAGSILPDYAEGLNSRVEITYDRYDEKGNILQYTRLDGIKVSYLWSYNYKYPVAEIVGATYDQVSTALGLNTVSLATNPNPDDNTINRIKALRTNLSNALVTVYTYKPLVGILTVTDPRGFATYYDYDTFGRLKRTYIKEDTTEKTIQTYDYHYQNQ